MGSNPTSATMDKHPTADTNAVLEDLMALDTSPPKLAEAVRANHAAALRALAKAGYRLVKD